MEISTDSKRPISSVSSRNDDCEVVSIGAEDEHDVKTHQETTGDILNHNHVSKKTENNVYNTTGNHKVKKFRKKRKRKLAGRFISILQGSPASGGRVTPTDMDDNPKPTPRHAFQTSENLQMKTIRESGFSDEEGPAAGTHGYMNTYLEEEHRTHKHAYDSNIYSVNSAGNPVPIIIESENEGVEPNDSDTRQLKNDEKTNDLFPWLRMGGSTKCCCCTKKIINKNGKAYSLWTKTFQPESFGMSVWLLIITLGFLFNLWSIPLRSSFYSEIQEPWQGVWFAVDALFDFMFVIDIYVVFRTSYVKSGVYVTDISQLTAFHRHRWTLIMDILAIVPTDLFFIKYINPYLRLNRILKIHRAVKFYEIVEKLSPLPNVWRCVNMLQLYCVPVHYNACFYYALSELHGFGDTMTSWMFPNPKYFPDYTVLYRRYTHSFYWSCGRLSVVGGHALPTTDWQYIFSLYMQLSAVTMLVVFIGFVTSLFTAKLTPKLEFERTVETTKDYMRHRKLPRDLQKRVIGFFQYCWDSRQFANLEENSLLGYLPNSIREEMEVHANYEALKKVSAFAQCDQNILRQLVMKLKRRLYLPGQFVYRSGDVADEMYIVAEGVLQVISEGHPSIYTIAEGETFGDENVLAPHQFIRRVGDVVSYGYSELYVLSYKDVIATLAKYPRIFNNIQHQRKYVGQRQAEECRAYGGKYSRLSPSAETNDPSLKSLSNIQYRLHKNDSSRHSHTISSGRHESPDSDYEGYKTTKRNSLTSNHFVNYDVIEKVNAVYEDNIRSMKQAIEDIWANELRTVRQKLQNTETERDTKTKEINQLRRKVNEEPTQAVVPNSTTEIQTSHLQREANIVKTEENVSQSSKDDVIPNKVPYETSITRDRRAKISSFKPRTVLGRNNSHIIKTVHKETGLDMFGSMNSITSSKEVK